MDKPAMFVGSSTEGLGVARAVRDLLHEDAGITLWNEGFFAVGSTFIETLVTNLPHTPEHVSFGTAPNATQSSAR